jgi:hypothetical protein
MLGGLDDVHEIGDVRLETGPDLQFRDLSVGADDVMGLGQGEHIRVDTRAKVLEGNTQRPQPAVSPIIEGEADRRSACRSLNGWGR